MINPVKNAIKEAERDKEIIRVFYKYGFGAFLRQINGDNVVKKALMKNENIEKYTNITRGKRLRKALEELGPTFVKLGQLMSTREDIFPSDIIMELKKLQDDVETYSYKEAKRIFKEETGLNMLEEFEKFDLEPLASASIGQVYRAKLKTGENVVVKIQRPGIEEKIDMDLRIMERLSKLIDKTVNKDGLMSFEKIISEFSYYLERELDYIHEGQNARTFYKNFKDDDNIVIPKVYWTYTTKRILVMDEIMGVRLSDTEKIEKLGYDKQEIAMIMAESFMKQVLIDGVFHGDPHAGNVIIVDKGKVGFIDFGIVGYLDNSTKRFISVIVNSIRTKNTDRIAEALIDINRDIDDVDEDSLKKDIHSIMNAYIDMPFDKVDLMKMMSDLMNVSQSYMLRIPPQMTMLAKSVVVIQGTINMLKPEFSVDEMVANFLKHMYRSDIDLKTVFLEIMNYMSDNALNAKHIPRKLNRIVNIFSRNRFSVRLEHNMTEDTKKTVEGVGRTIAFGIIISTMIIASTLLLTSPFVHETKFIRALIVINLIADIIIANMYIIKYVLKRK